MTKNLKWTFTMSIVLIFLFSFFSLFVSQVDARTYVHGYHRKDGTYVHGYYRGGGSGSSYSNDSTYAPSEPYIPNSTYVPSIPENYPPITTSYSVPTGSVIASRVVNLYKGNNTIGTTATNNLVYVHGYYRQDGTYVRPHYRTHPNNFIQDNFSYDGISTLPPLQRYPFYIPESDKHSLPIEHYLFYQTSNYKLNDDQLIHIKQYTSSLSIDHESAHPDDQKKALDLGLSFYQSLGINPLISQALAEYDWTGIVTPQSYLSQLLLENKKGAKISEETLYLQKAYLIALVGAKENGWYKSKVQNIGLAYYRSILGDSSTQNDIEDQINMDMLQNFEDSSELKSIKETLQVLNQYVGIYQNNNISVEKYLKELTAIYNLQANEDPNLYKSELVNYSEYRTIAYYYLQDGINFYISSGLSKDIAEKQAIYDLIIFF